MVFEVEKDGNVTPSEIEKLRDEVGWDNTAGQCERALEKAFSRFVVRNKGKLIGYLSVVSDGVADALLVDFIVHPDFRRKGIGTKMVRTAVLDLKNQVQCVHVTFNPGNEAFYRHMLAFTFLKLE